MGSSNETDVVALSEQGTSQRKTASRYPVTSAHLDEDGEESGDVVDCARLLESMRGYAFVVARRDGGLGNELGKSDDLRASRT